MYLLPEYWYSHDGLNCYWYEWTSGLSTIMVQVIDY